MLPSASCQESGWDRRQGGPGRLKICKGFYGLSLSFRCLLISCPCLSHPSSQEVGSQLCSPQYLSGGEVAVSQTKHAEIFYVGNDSVSHPTIRNV